MRNKGLLAVLALFCIFCSSASGQTHTSTVFGNVRDESGAVLQAAEIQMIEENTRSTRNAMSGRNAECATVTCSTARAPSCGICVHLRPKRSIS